MVALEYLCRFQELEEVVSQRSNFIGKLRSLSGRGSKVT